jgi:beta-galactosidase/beta-glucuronidase
MRLRFIILIFLFSGTSLYSQSLTPTKTKIVKKGNRYQLLVNNKPYFIKGAGAQHYLERLKQYGGNSIRTQSDVSILNKANSLGLTALIHLPVKAERDGMNYDDEVAVKKQHQRVMDIVRKTKDHPAVIMWELGNELDFIQANVKDRYNPKVWDAVNALSKEIHKLDPNHPILTVVGSLDKDKTADLIRMCPDLDLLGINEYGDLLKIPLWLREFGWKKPYVVTEWGPTGFWQVPKTPWKVPIEETSSMKANKYKERYEQTISKDKDMCLGSYVFLWRQHQERTHTWFGMFDKDGLETEAVDVMHFVWTGKWPKNRTPFLDSIKIGKQTAYNGVELKAQNTYDAQVWSKDPDNDRLEYKWEILAEGTNFPYGGGGEKRPPSIPNLISSQTGSKIEFKAPDKEGSYRLFVYVYDGKNHFATANIPFLNKL